MSDGFITVTVLNDYIERIVDAEDMLHNICVVGEVSGLKCSGAHAYFSLKDENAQMRCCSFGYARRYLPRDGESVMIRGSLDFYAKGGTLSFNATEIQPIGKGALALQYELLKKKLSEQGYFDESKKKAIPKYCDRVCVLTARTGAVIRDIITTVRKNNHLINIDIYPVKVQGQGCAESVIHALKIADKLNYDAIIIARGGGSFEDLNGFNDEALVYAVYDAKTPVISAVGHQTDFTLCDFVADKRCATPTAAAELVAYSVADLTAGIIGYAEKYGKLLKNKWTDGRARLETLTRRIISANSLTVSRKRGDIERLNYRLSSALKRKAEICEERLKHILTRINSNNPLRILSQGYWKVYKGGKESKIAELERGDNITVMGEGGKVTATVNNVEIEKL